ncbi:MAG: 50S ribosomal protein L18 [Candidatus Aenigmarchaeota archaeon]|nr:50S ribosomal protein L18 [Candidatus Aenigmarchaeota archaeon]
MFRRRREKKTDYAKRLALLKSRKIRVVVKRSLNYIHIQFIAFEKSGDKVLLEETSKNLKRYDWKGHYGNLPSAYLTGLVAGFEALSKGIEEAILDIGLQTSIKGNALYAAALGIKDAGVVIPMSQEMLKERIEGLHIVAYAKTLKNENAEKYKRQFADYLKKGLEPEKLHEHFTQVKENIIKSFKSDENV